MCQSFVFYYTIQCCPAWQRVWYVCHDCTETEILSCDYQLDFNKGLLLLLFIFLYTRLLLLLFIICESVK